MSAGAAAKPLTEPQRARAAAYIPLARDTIGGFLRSHPGIPADAVASEVCGALVGLARRYRADSPVDFAVYAKPRLVGACRDAARRHVREAIRFPTVELDPADAIAADGRCDVEGMALAEDHAASARSLELARLLKWARANPPRDTPRGRRACRPAPLPVPLAGRVRARAMV